MAILPFKEGYFYSIWARHSCFSLTHLCRSVSPTMHAFEFK